MDLINDLLKIFLERQEKYIYYVVALSVASIGFSIYTTTGKSLSFTQIPLGLAVFGWGISIYCGLRFLRYSISRVNMDADFIRLPTGLHPIAGKNQELISRFTDIASNAMRKDDKFVIKLFNGMEWGFYLGVLLFVCWHVIEMYFVVECIM